ncbi:MAG: hypothetical protein JWN08_2037 [Frankiales bacterium]|nr:hypothetical protein [Frankiales bacterium]
MSDLEDVLDRLSEVVEQARALPMSSSCVVNRDEVLGLLDDARASLPSALARAERVLRERQSLLDGAATEAAAVVAQAQQEQSRLVEATAVFTRAQDEADRLLAAARADAEAMRLQTEDYVDAKLANFEVVLAKTLATVERGRSRLSGRTDYEPLRSDDLDALNAEDPDQPV